MTPTAGRPSAEPIAELVADLRAGRVDHQLDGRRGAAINAEALTRAQEPQPVVDATALYWDLHRRVIGGGEGVNLYDDHPSVAPPWPDALVCYINEHGNTVALQVHAEPSSESRRWETDNPLDWGRVRWIVETMIWAGGQGGDGRSLPTTGPLHLLQHAIYPDGQPADIHWTQLLPEYDRAMWEVPLLVLSSVLTFLNCANVEVAEPQRPRSERRRIARTGVTVQTIVVRPPGKRTRTTGTVRAADGDDTPLRHVRGHFSHYGEQYGRGLLFGKYAGKFWIPARAAAAVEPKTYVLKPAGSGGC